MPEVISDPFLSVIFSDAESKLVPELDLHSVKVALINVTDDWSRQQEQEPPLTDEVREMITKALGYLNKAVDDVLSGVDDCDGFVNTVFQCRDHVMALDLMLRAQRIGYSS